MHAHLCAFTHACILSMVCTMHPHAAHVRAMYAHAHVHAHVAVATCMRTGAPLPQSCVQRHSKDARGPPRGGELYQQGTGYSTTILYQQGAGASTTIACSSSTRTHFAHCADNLIPSRRQRPEESTIYLWPAKRQLWVRKGEGWSSAAPR